MFSNDKNIEIIASLGNEIKRYIHLREKQVKLDATLILSQLLAAVALAAVIIILLGAVLLVLTFALSSLVADWVGSEAMSYALIALAYALLAALICFKRNAWIKEPIVRFVSALLVKNDENETSAPNKNI
ncbi:MAG: phage holin family protein [Alloprevotella sp.]